MLVHGDDFVSSGERTELEFEEERGEDDHDGRWVFLLNVC